AVRADVTVTFGAIKPGLLIDPGASHAGIVELVDIGLRPYLTSGPCARAPQRDDISELLRRPGPESDKYRRGVLGLLAGSDRFTGAALLSAGGAVHGGTGVVRGVTGPAAAAPGRPGPGLGCRPGRGDGPGRSGAAAGDPAHRPAGAGGRGRADDLEPAPGPAPARGADADHAARR